jgi:hypothetical protein
VRSRQVAGAHDLLAYGTLRCGNSEPRWDDHERAARLRFERDLAQRELTGDGTRRRRRRTRLLIRGLRTLQRTDVAGGGGVTTPISVVGGTLVGFLRLD